MTLKVKKESVLKLFELFGFKTVRNWNEERLMKKIKDLPNLVDASSVKDKKQRRLIDALMEADKVILTDKDVGLSLQEAKRHTTKKKTEKGAKKKVTKKVSGKSGRKESKSPGVIMSVLEFVKSGQPISEKSILAKLKKRFPKRDSKSMGRSISRVPYYLAKNKNADIIKKNNKGQYYIKK